MNFQNYTQKSMEAVQNAKNLAIQNNNQQMEQIHLLLALLQQDGGLVPQLLKKMDVTVESLEAAANTELNRVPSVTGSREADRFYISADMDAAFNVTGERRKALVEAVKAFVYAPAVYQNAPSFAYVIGDYTVSKTGTVSGPTNEALMAALNAKGFIVE